MSFKIICNRCGNEVILIRWKNQFLIKISLIIKVVDKNLNVYLNKLKSKNNKIIKCGKNKYNDLEKITEENNSERFQEVLEELIKNENARQAKILEEQRKIEEEENKRRLEIERKKREEVLKRQKIIEEARKKEMEKRTKLLLEQQQKSVLKDKGISFETIKDISNNNVEEEEEKNIPRAKPRIFSIAWFCFWVE